MSYHAMVSLQHRRLYESVEDQLITEIFNLSPSECMARGQPRHVYLERIHQLQRRRVFPFLKLPPEMRNLIYPHLLKHNRKEGSTAYPALLRTCKQIYKEASPRLNHESLVQLSLRFGPREHDETGRLDYLRCGRFQSVRLEYASQTRNVIQAMRHVKHIRINIRTLQHGRDLETLTETASNLTRFLAGLFEVCNSLKTLELEFSPVWDGHLESFTLCHYLTSVVEELEKRPDDCELKVKGLLRKTVEQAMDVVKFKRYFDGAV